MCRSEPDRAGSTLVLFSFSAEVVQFGKPPLVARAPGSDAIVATEPPIRKGSSEDLIVVYAPEWTPDFLSNLEERKRLLNIAQPGNYTEYAIERNEFPEMPRWSSDRHPTNP